MEIKSKEITLVDLELLVENPKNNNTHPEDQIERLVKLIKHTGFRNPLIVSNRSGFVLCGHGRIAAAKRAGLKQLPVIYQDFDNEAEEYAYMTADNAIHNWSSIDLAKVNTEMLDFGPGFDIDMLGIKDFVIEPIEKFEPQGDEDAVPEVINPITRRGDIWLLGNHRLMCGDSTMIDDVEKLMNGEKADMVFTDPPYGMHLDTNYSKMPTSPNGAKPLTHRKIAGDGEDFTAELIQTIFTNFDYCKEIYIWGADYFSELIPNRNSGGWYIWDKRVSENFDKMIGSAFETCWSKAKHKREIARINNTLFSGESDARSKIHPTQKPIKLVEFFFERVRANKIVDLFLGSGTTLIACEKHNRKCFGIEMDEKYCDGIISRWQKYTGKKATLELTGQTYEELKQERENVTT